MSPPVRIALLIAVSLAFCLPTLTSKLTRDDYFHWALLTGSAVAPTLSAESPLSLHDATMRLFAFLQPGEGDTLEQARASGLIPWWADNRLEVEFWRPVAAISHWLDYQWWPDSPLLMHWHSAVWYALLLCSLWYFLTQLGLKGAVLGVAVALYALDASHLVAIGWLANRNIMLAGCFAFLSLAFYHRSTLQSDPKTLLGAAILLAASLLSAEGGLAIAGFMMSHALFLDQRTWSRRVFWLGTMAVVVVGWRVIYGTLGFAARNSGAYFDPVADPASFIDNALIQIPILIMDQLTGIESLQLLMAPHTLVAQAVVGAVFVVIVSLLFLPLLRQNPIARFFYAGALLAMVPAGTTLFTGGRLLFISGAGLLVVLSMYLVGVYQRQPWLPRGTLKGLPFWIGAIGLTITTLVANGYIWYTLEKQSLNQDQKRVYSSLANALEHYNGQADHLLVVNPPIQFDLMYAQVIAQYHQLPHPRYLNALVPGVAPLVITRTGINRLEIRSETDSLAISPNASFAPVAGALSSLYGARRADQFFAGTGYRRTPGEIITLPDLQVEVLDTSAAGVPARIAVTLKNNLDAIAYQWLYWHHESNGYETLTIPAPGESVRLAGPFEQTTITTTK